MNIYDSVEKNGHYTELKLQSVELLEIRNIIEKHYAHMNETYSLGINEEIPNYHREKPTFNHGSFWSKDKRILNNEAVFKIRQMPFFKELISSFGDFNISNEKEIEKEECYFRICRPNEKQDFAPMHADYWFWELNNWEMPENKKRVKVWIAIWGERGLNGLRYVPSSHKKDFSYKDIKQDGLIDSKPQIISKEESLDIKLFDCESGSIIVFHDRLLHGGAMNRGKNTRISLEFTILVDDIQGKSNV